MRTISCFVSIVLLLAASLPSIASAQTPDPEHVYVLPYFIPEDEAGNRVLFLTPQQHLVLGARWGACTYGLVRAWTQTSEVYYEVDGSPLLPSSSHSKGYWGQPIHIYTEGDTDCISQPGDVDEYWVAYWEYDFGTLEEGRHQFFFRYSMPHSFHSGEDTDDQPGPDKMTGWTMEITFWVEVD